MTRPGVSVISRSDPPSQGIVSDTGTWFVVGAAEKGPVDKAQRVRNLNEFKQFFGDRVSYSILYDALETFFREGGSQAYVVRVSGASATKAAKTLMDGQGTPVASLRVEAKNPGAWGNSLSAAVVAGATVDERIIIVTHSTLGEVDRSPSLADQAAGVSWGQSSDWVNVSIPGGASTQLPAVAAASALTGGTDDTAGINDTLRQAALGYFTHDLGPGQVSIPGTTSSGNRNALIAHAKVNNRQALFDATDSPSRSTLVTEAAAFLGQEYGAMFAPWVRIPGVVAGTTRIVPPSALVAGLMARSDATKSPNEAAAGNNGLARFAVGLTQSSWADADRQQLNEGGVNVIIAPAGQIKLYGYRTLANPLRRSPWLSLANQRLRHAISADAEAIAERYLFDQIDGRGHKLAEFAGDLTGMLLEYYNDDSLYGATPEQAFSVDVGPTVNTEETLADNQLNAIITVRMSPFAEQVTIEIAKVSVSEVL